jgi:peptidylprolyl isomerase
MSTWRTLHRLLTVSLVAAVASVGSIALAGGPAGAVDARLSSVTVQGADGEKPTLQFTAPFAAATSTHRVVTKGTGETITKGAKVTIEYVVVDGRTGEEVDTSFGAKPVALPLDTEQVAPVLVKSLIGVKVGSRVLVAIAPKEGLTKNLSGAGVTKGDTLLFELVAQPLIKGTGPEVTAGQNLTVHYTGVIWDTGKQFDSSWDRGEPSDFQIGTGNVIQGWDTGLVGQTVGSQVLLVVPPEQGYGSQGSKDAGISGTDTLVFVVDILDAI